MDTYLLYMKAKWQRLDVECKYMCPPSRLSLLDICRKWLFGTPYPRDIEAEELGKCLDEASREEEKLRLDILQEWRIEATIKEMKDSGEQNAKICPP